MSSQKELEQVILHTDKLLQGLGLVLVDARFGQQGKNRTLEIVIHKPGTNVSLSDCEEISRTLDETVSNIISGGFSLEVQSPGIDRVLKSTQEMNIFSGHSVEIKLKQGIDHLGDFFLAKLISATEENITAESARKIPSTNKRNKTPEVLPIEHLTIPRVQVAQVRLSPQLEKEEIKSSKQEFIVL